MAERSTISPGLDLLRVAVVRWWWIVVLVPAVAMVASLFLTQSQPYRSEVRASVLIPGDNEDTGNSERPELMVLDDLPSLVRSQVFAEGVHAAMGATTLSVNEVSESLDASRYSRILTVYVSSDDSLQAQEIASAVELSVGDLINAYLMPEGEEVATVRIIDPASVPSRDRPQHISQVVVSTSLGLAAGLGLAVAAESLVHRRPGVPDSSPAHEAAGRGS